MMQCNLNAIANKPAPRHSLIHAVKLMSGEVDPAEHPAMPAVGAIKQAQQWWP